MHVVGSAEERDSWIQRATEALTGSRKRLKVFSVSRWGKERASPFRVLGPRAGAIAAGRAKVAAGAGTNEKGHRVGVEFNFQKNIKTSAPPAATAAAAAADASRLEKSKINEARAQCNQWLKPEHNRVATTIKQHQKHDQQLQQLVKQPGHFTQIEIGRKIALSREFHNNFPCQTVGLSGPVQSKQCWAPKCMQSILTEPSGSESSGWVGMFLLKGKNLAD
ncbi:GD21709 [Drosophila simulans]|uniref:GD21709 n=1 Tax=Drosophila simulans TaxID=7240 RepID=B4QAI5_DROSI|nr:GD21709 [Drosophila simulans]